MKRSIQTLIALLLLGGVGSAVFADDNAGSWRQERQELRKEQQLQRQDRRAIRQDVQKQRQCVRQDLRRERQQLRQTQRTFRGQCAYRERFDRRYAQRSKKPVCSRDGRYRHDSYGRPVAVLNVRR